MSFWLATILLLLGSGKSFLIKQISECTTKTVYVTSTTGRAAKVLRNKAKTIHSFAGIGDCHEPKEVCCVFRVLCGFLFCLFCFRKIYVQIQRCTHFDFRSLPHILFPFPQLAETCDKKSEKFHLLSLYYFRCPKINLRVPDFCNLGSRPRTSRPRNLPRARIKEARKAICTRNN